MGIGDWGLGIGDWRDWAQSPIPNPQSPIPNPHNLYNILNYLCLKYLLKIFHIKINKSLKILIQF